MIVRYVRGAGATPNYSILDWTSGASIIYSILGLILICIRLLPPTCPRTLFCCVHQFFYSFGIVCAIQHGRVRLIAILRPNIANEVFEMTPPAQQLRALPSALVLHQAWMQASLWITRSTSVLYLPFYLHRVNCLFFFVILCLQQRSSYLFLCAIFWLFHAECWFPWIWGKHHLYFVFTDISLCIFRYI